MTNAKTIAAIADAIAEMEPVAVTAQGVSHEYDVSAFPVETIAAWLTYGTRRAFQDHVNSVAHKLRKEEKEVDANAIIDAYAERAMNGEINTRAASSDVDPLDAYRRIAVRAQFKSPANAKSKAAYDAIDAKDRKARDEYLLAVAAKHADQIDPIAESLKAIDDERDAALVGVPLDA